MTSFYDRKGPKSWTEGGVPNFITSNSYIAKSYAKVWKDDSALVVHAFIQFLCDM
jgi:hypothetical protein